MKRAAVTTIAMASLLLIAPGATAHPHVDGAKCKDVRFKKFPDFYATNIRAENLACVPARQLVRDTAFSESTPYDCRMKLHQTLHPHYDFTCTDGPRKVSWSGYGPE